MTETTNSSSQGTFLAWLVAIVLAVAVVVALGEGAAERETRKSCMDSVQTPDPKAGDYDRQALDFTAEIRKCLRG